MDCRVRMYRALVSFPTTFKIGMYQHHRGLILHGFLHAFVHHLQNVMISLFGSRSPNHVVDMVLYFKEELTSGSGL